MSETQDNFIHWMYVWVTFVLIFRVIGSLRRMRMDKETKERRLVEEGRISWQPPWSPLAQFRNGEKVSQDPVSHLLDQNLVSLLLGQKPSFLCLDTKKKSHWCGLRACKRRSAWPGQRQEQGLTSQRLLLDQTRVTPEDHPTWAKGVQPSKNIYSTKKHCGLLHFKNVLGVCPAGQSCCAGRRETTAVTQRCQSRQHLYSFNQRTLH